MDYMSPQQQLLYLYDYHATNAANHDSDTHTVTRSHSISTIPLPRLTPAPPATPHLDSDSDSVSTISSALSAAGMSKRTPSYSNRRHRHHRQSSLDFLTTPGMSTRGGMRYSPAAHHRERVVHIAQRKVQTSPYYLFSDECPLESRDVITPFERDAFDADSDEVGVHSKVDDAHLLDVPAQMSEDSAYESDEEEEEESHIYKLLLNDRELRSPRSRSHGVHLKSRSENESVKKMEESGGGGGAWPFAPVCVHSAHSVHHQSMEPSWTPMQYCV